jgi:ATP-dependent helicase/nuclease subunit A
MGDCIINFDDDGVVYDINTPLILEASAGSGKTTVLVERWMAILIYSIVFFGKTPVEAVGSIIAITFTKKAASEMKERIRIKVSECFDGFYLKSVVNKLNIYIPPGMQADIDKRIKYCLYVRDEILSALVSAPISTIHSFALSILRENPVEARVDPLAAPSDEGGVEKLSVTLRDAIFSTFRLLIDKEDENLSYIINIFGYEKTLEIAERFFIKSTEMGFEGFKEIIKNSGYLEFEAELKSPGSFDLHGFIDKHIAPDIDNLKALIENHDTINKRSIAETRNLARNIDVFWNKLSEGLYDSVFSLNLDEEVKMITKPEVNAIKEEINSATKSLKFKIHKLIMPPLLKMIELCYKKFETLKIERKEITFSDIELKLVAALRSNPGFVCSLRKKYGYILIDEYQDTSDIQKDIFDFFITPDKEHSIIPFIVGDPKQSIYRFRNSNVEVFINTRDEFFRRYGENSVKSLANNYRSVDGVVDGVNAMFSEIMTGDYQAQNSVKKSQSDSEGLWFIKTDFEKIDDIINEAATYVAKIIAYLINSQGYQPRDFMILTLRKKRIDILNRALAGMGLPFVNIADENIAQSAEVRNVIAYLQALDNPYNDYVFLSLLKSPFFRKSDSEILSLSRLKKEEGKSSLFEVLKTENKLSREIEIFIKLHNLKNRVNIPDLIEEIIKTTGYFAYLNTIPERKNAVTNVIAFIDKLRFIQNFKMFNLTDFLYYLQTYGIHIESPKIVGEKSNVIRVMTVFAAKGLESRVVFYIPSSSSTGNRGDCFIIEKDGDRYKFGINLMGKDCNYIDLSERDKEKNFEENKRLAYVAVTRARERFYYMGFGYNRDMWKDFMFDNVPGGREIDFDKLGISDSDCFSVEIDKTDYIKNLGETVEERIDYLIDKEAKIEKTKIPSVITITQLLDMEFRPAAFKNRYITKSYPLEEALNEVIDATDDNILTDNNRADKGTFLHNVFQYASPSDYMDFIECGIYKEDASIRKDKDKIIGIARKFFESDFYKQYFEQNGFEREELEFNFPLQTSGYIFIIKGSVDKYILKDGEGIIIDYKLSVGDKGRERYARQLNYYGFILKKLGFDINRLFLYDIESASVIESDFKPESAKQAMLSNIELIIREFKRA